MSIRRQLSSNCKRIPYLNRELYQYKRPERSDEMMEAIQLEEQGHVQSLLKRSDMIIALHCSEQTIHVVINDGLLFFQSPPNLHHPTFTIHITKEAITQLLEGKKKLRELEKQGQIEMSAPLRIKLWLESIFYLTSLKEKI